MQTQAQYIKFSIITVISFLIVFNLSVSSQQSQIKVGADVFVENHLDLVYDKRIGIVTNHTGILSDGRHIVDVLHSHEKIPIVKLFSPEHGIRGVMDSPIDDSIEPQTGLPIISLYGNTRKPTKEMLDDIDVLIFDIQDVGARFYTYISTLYYILQAASEFNIKTIVLDRPNPITASQVEGNILNLQFKSFIGIHPIPVRHGMTVGELAQLFNSEEWSVNGRRADLTVIPIDNYQRTMWFDETGLQWVKPSPNMLTLNTAIVYPATCFLEGTNISEGRGTEHPFEWIGAPWIDGVNLAETLNRYDLPGIIFKPVEFIPGEIVDGIKIHPPKYLGETCSGVRLAVHNRTDFQPVRTGIYILYTLLQLYPDKFHWDKIRTDQLWGTDRIRLMLSEGNHPEEIINLWEEESEAFLQIRSKYLLYK